MTFYRESAPAKINLFLDITEKRKDGYHLIDGVMQSVSLCDEITVGFELQNSVEDPSRFTIEIIGNNVLPTDEKNLAVKAAKLFLDMVGISAKIHILLQKNIPMEAGLAGGSTDAAAVLRALTRALTDEIEVCKSNGKTLKKRNGKPVSVPSQKELLLFAEHLGADVPFCLHPGAKRTQGIGEILSTVPPLPRCFLLIARGKEGVSTPLGYQKLDEKYHQFQNCFPKENELKLLLNGLEKNALLDTAKACFNIFEDVVGEAVPEVKTLRKTMEKGGAVRAMMSGSGPSVFGIFEDENAAKSVQKELLSKGFFAQICEPISTARS